MQVGCLHMEFKYVPQHADVVSVNSLQELLVMVHEVVHKKVTEGLSDTQPQSTSSAAGACDLQLKRGLFSLLMHT